MSTRPPRNTKTRSEWRVFKGSGKQWKAMKSLPVMPTAQRLSDRELAAVPRTEASVFGVRLGGQGKQ